MEGEIREEGEMRGIKDHITEMKVRGGVICITYINNSNLPQESRKGSPSHYLHLVLSIDTFQVDFDEANGEYCRRNT